MSENGSRTVQWHRVLAASELPDGRVTTVAAGHKNVALVHFDAGRSGEQRRPAARAGEWQTSLHNPDFSAYARNCGAHGVRVSDRAMLDDALAEAVAHDGPAMVEVITDPNLV